MATKANLVASVHRINKMLEHLESNRRLGLSFRYSYHAVDIYVNGEVGRTLCTGSANKIGDILYGVEEGFRLSEKTI